jgi:hypothetical protein
MKLRIVGLEDSTKAGTPGFLSPLEAPPSGSGNAENQYAYRMMKSHSDWTILNRGINGQRTDEILARFDRVVQERPSCAIILAVVNGIYQGDSMERTKGNLLAPYEKSLIAHIRPVACTVLPYNPASDEERKNIRELNKFIETSANRFWERIL